MSEKMYNGMNRETSETILKDVANSFNNLDLRDSEAVSEKIEELKRGGYTTLVSFLEEMSHKYLELTQK